MSKTLNCTNYPQCPIRNVLSRLSDKWSLLIFYTLEQHGTLRFKELQRSIPDISQKMLTVTLRTLEQDSFIFRKVYAEVPPKVEYSLTPRAESLQPNLKSILDWATTTMGDIVSKRITPKTA